MKFFVVLASLTLAVFSHHVYYVRPNNSSSCPDQPCLTLDQYVSQGTEYFSTGAMFFFLAGTHDIWSTVILQNVSDIIFKGEENSFGVTVLCNSPSHLIICDNVTNFSIKEIRLMLYTDASNSGYSDVYAWPNVLQISGSRKISFTNLIFQGRSVVAPKRLILQGAANINHSHVAIISCVFENNTALYGGAIYATGGSNIILEGNTFLYNEAMQGGAVFVEQSTLFLSGNDFSYNRASHFGGAICLMNESSLLLRKIPGNSFKYNTALRLGGAIASSCSRISTVEGESEDYSSTTSSRDELICLLSSDYEKPDGPTHILCQYKCCTIFAGNEAMLIGGAVYLENSEASLIGIPVLIFHNNLAKIHCGGAITNRNSNTTINSKLVSFTENNASLGGVCCGSVGSLVLEAISLYFDKNFAVYSGGAIIYQMGQVIISGKVSYFTNNYVIEGIGGAIKTEGTSVLLNGDAIHFMNNSAHSGQGGGIGILWSVLVIKAKKVNFVGNRASNGGAGGALFAQSSKLQVCETVQLNLVDNRGFSCFECLNSQCNVTSVSYIDNTCKAIVIAVKSSSFHRDVNISSNLGTPIAIENANISFSGQVIISRNKGGNDCNSGGILAKNSFVSFSGNTTFEENSGNQEYGAGALLLELQTTIIFSGVVLFRNNSATTGNGGAIFATDSKIILRDVMINFTSNKAENGGAMYIENGASLKIEKNTTLTTSLNRATKFGGAIYHKDAVTTSQCELSTVKHVDTPFLPYCFIDLTLEKNSNSFWIMSVNDLASLNGSFLYGGLLDKCLIQTINNESTHFYYEYHMSYELFYYTILTNPNISTIVPKPDPMTGVITSLPYLLCFCESDANYNCSEVKTVEIYRGGKLTISLLALAQADTITSTFIRAKLSPTARLIPSQILQFLPRKCTDISYNLYSSEEQEELILFLNDGTCRDIGAACSVVNVTFLPCPDVFTLSGDECTCEERLKAFNAECAISGEGIHITRKTDSRFWISPLFKEGVYQGLISYPICPLGYCKTESINITLFKPNFQCDSNRSGLLCGACVANYSLVLGGSDCQVCSNTYLFLLLPFAAAGVVLVVFLLVFKLTVATGMINSVILYANIVQANKALLFPTSITTTNVLTVFIAWMNLDLGFHTCFCDGMDAYTKTWLQFAFPLYVWFLLILIILTSRYSITVTKLLGTNPIAVLATLLLMSYAKILKIIIAVYSPVKLEYPGNSTVTMWLIDANLTYLQSRHLVLTVVTTLVLVFLFLPYTLLLLFGYKLYGGNQTRWLTRIKPLLDSYYAPYKMRTRYWPGFLLLVRCVLYIALSCDSVVHSNRSLFAIIIVFAAVITCLSFKIYANLFNNVVEVLVYLNLIVLAAAALSYINSPVLTYLLVGKTFVIMIVIILYHSLYFGKILLLKVKMFAVLKGLVSNNDDAIETTPLLGAVVDTPPPKAVVTKSVIEIK